MKAEMEIAIDDCYRQAPSIIDHVTLGGNAGWDWEISPAIWDEPFNSTSLLLEGLG
jgi:hypothetical protein